MINHANGKKDNRYSCALEYCGYSVPMYVSRFYGELIGVSRDIEKAQHVMETHAKERLANA